MAFNGSGTYVRNYNWTQDAANAIPITASRFDTEHDGFAAGLTLCVTRDGQGKMAASFTPSTNNSYDVGGVGAYWKDGYFAGGLTVNGPVSTDNTTADEIGYKGTPQLVKSSDYTLILTDAGKQIYCGTGLSTLTIPANASVAFPIGTFVRIFNFSPSPISIAITSNSLLLLGTASGGTRTLAVNGAATLEKVEATLWCISGVGVS